MLNPQSALTVHVGHNRPNRVTGILEDVVLLVLVIFLFPLAILLIGAPIALCIRIVIEVMQRL